MDHAENDHAAMRGCTPCTSLLLSLRPVKKRRDQRQNDAPKSTLVQFEDEEVMDTGC